MSEKNAPKLVGNKSKGYNYKYTSLGDLVIAGVELPPMRIAILTNAEGEPVIVDGQPVEYVEAKMSVGNAFEWVRGARVVIPKSTKMNEAQAYGSAITYARRYTALMLLGIACDDDNKIEVRSKAEAEAQELEGMKKELAELYKKAGGKAFENWLKERGGLTYKTFASLKVELVKRITANEEEKESKE